MGNNCFGFKKCLIRRLRPQPTLLIIPALMSQSKSKDCHVVVLGAAGVGKSVPVWRWVRGNFRDVYLPAIADTDCYVLSSNHGFGFGALHSTDTTRSPRYPGLQRLAIARDPAFILVYSVTKKQTLEEPFCKLICKVKDNPLREYPIVLVDNKCQESRWESTVSNRTPCALEWNCAFLETFAEMGISVQELLHTLWNHEKTPAACLHHPQKKSLMPKTAEKLLRKCIVM